jgi:hypothetical protein
MCGQDITDPSMALVTWQSDRGSNAREFRIVHKGMCDPGADVGYVQSVELGNFLGPDGVAYLLSMLSLGPLKGPGESMPEVSDFDGYVDLFRRVQTPWYEEARRRFDEEAVINWLSDASEVLPYHPDVLERIARGTLGR